MSNYQAHQYPVTGQHYSGSNRIPNIKQFAESLDRDKKNRDKKVEEREHRLHHGPVQPQANGGDVQDHVPTHSAGKNRRTVTDPVTGNEVEVVDITSDIVKNAAEPKVSSPFSSWWYTDGGRADTQNPLVNRPQRESEQTHNLGHITGPVRRGIPKSPR